MGSALGEMLFIVLILAACIGFTGWSMKYIHRLKEERHQPRPAEDLPQPVEDPPQNRQSERQQEHVSTKNYIKVPTSHTSRSQLKHPEQYTKEEIEEAVAMGFIPPDDPAVDAALRPGERRQIVDDPDLRSFGRGELDLEDADLAHPDFDKDLHDDFDNDLEDPDLRDDFEDPDLRDDFDDDLEDLDLSDDLDDLDHDEDDWDREDAVMRAQSNLRIMREEDQNYALDAIEAEVLNLDHEPDEDELVAIADRAADFYDMSEDYRDY